MMSHVLDYISSALRHAHSLPFTTDHYPRSHAPYQIASDESVDVFGPFTLDELQRYRSGEFVRVLLLLACRDGD